MSKAFGNGKRNISGTEKAKELRNTLQYKFAKELSKNKCDYIDNNTLNSEFTIDYKYTSDSLVSAIRNTSSYDTLYSLSLGYNLCNCLGNTKYNVQGDLLEIQKYGYQDLTGITLYDESGNKLFDDYFYKACGYENYTEYDSVKTKNQNEMVTDESLYLNNFNYPKQIPLTNEYVKPQIKLLTNISNINYSLNLLPLTIKTIIDRCFKSNIDITDIIASLYKKVVVNTVLTATDVIYTYDVQQVENDILQGTLVSNNISELLNEFTNLSIQKPDLNYILKFNNIEVPEIQSTYFNIYGQIKNFKGDGFNNTEIPNEVFSSPEAANQGATIGTLSFTPTISGDYYYQSQFNNDIFGTINVFDAPINHTTNTFNYDIQVLTDSLTQSNKQYYVNLSGDAVVTRALTIDTFVGDTLNFNIVNEISYNPLFIQTSQGATDDKTIILDASYVLGVAGKTISTISMEIMDNLNNRFTKANNSVTIKIEPVSNIYQADLSGTLIKNAIDGVLIFDDLMINKPATNYKFKLFTEKGEILETNTPEFDIYGEIEAIENNVNQYFVGEDISNIGSKILLGEDDDTTIMHYSISGGEINNTSSYVNNFDVSMLGNLTKTLYQGEMMIDNSINKIGKNYKIIFDASNTTKPITTNTFDIVAKLDITNTSTSTDLSFIAGTDLSNFDIKLLDVNNNIIPFNSPLNLVTKQIASNNTILTLNSQTINIIDGSANLSDISINENGLRFFIELQTEHGDASKNTQNIDIFANVDVSNQPLLAANRIVSNTYMPIFIKSTNINNEPMETITSYTISSVTNDILNGTKIVTSNPDGVAEFNNIIFYREPEDTSYKEYKLQIEATDPESNLRPIITESFNILYTNWNTQNEKQIAPGINTQEADSHYIQLDQVYRPYDNSYILIQGSTPQDNDFWKETTIIPGSQYMRTMKWDMSDNNANAGGIYRIQRKLYTTDASNQQYNSDADFSFIPLHEFLDARENSRDPHVYYYDYSFNTNFITREAHQAHAHSLSYDTTKYDTSWSLTTIRSQEESDMLALKMHNDVPAYENNNYYIGGQLSVYEYSENHNSGNPYGHVLYTWDISGEKYHYIWAGVKTVILPS